MSQQPEQQPPPLSSTPRRESQPQGTGGVATPSQQRSIIPPPTAGTPGSPPSRTAVPPPPPPPPSVGSPVVNQNSQADALAALQQDYAKQQASLVKLHEMHSKRVSDLEGHIVLLRQKLEETSENAKATEKTAKDFETKFVIATASHEAEIAEVRKQLATAVQEADGKVAALQLGLNDVYAGHNNEVTSLTAALAATRAQLLREHKNTWNMPKLISDAVNDTIAASTEHVAALEGQVAASRAESRGLESEVSRLRAQLTEMSAREASVVAAGTVAIGQCQAKAAEWQYKFESVSMQARALEGRQSLLEQDARSAVEAQVAQLQADLDLARVGRSKAEENFTQKAKEVAALEAVLKEERTTVAADSQRLRQDAWQSKVALTSLSQQYNDAVKALQSEISDLVQNGASAVAQRDATIAALQEEVSALTTAAQTQESELHKRQADEIASLRKQLSASRNASTPTVASPTSLLRKDEENKAEEENAQLKATVQNLQMQVALQKQQSECTLAEARHSASTQIEALRRETAASASQAQQHLTKFRNESASAMQRATAMDDRVKELEAEVKMTKSELNKAQAKLVLLEAKQAGAVGGDGVEGGDRGENDSPVRKKPAQSRRK